MSGRWVLPGLLAGLGLAFAVPHYGWVNKYQQMILMYVGISVILAASLKAQARKFTQKSRHLGSACATTRCVGATGG